MSLSKELYERYYPRENNEEKQETVENLTLYDYQDHLETEYGAPSQLPRFKQLIAAFKEDFSKSSFTINYVLIINSVIIISIILSLCLLTLIGGIFNNFVLILGIITMILIFMIFESLALLEKEITQKEEEEEKLR